MPRTFEAWRSDHLSTDQVHHLIFAHDTNPDVYLDHEETLVEAVEPLGIFDTARAVTYWRWAVNEPAFEREAESLHAQRRIHLSATFEGMERARPLTRPFWLVAPSNGSPATPPYPGSSSDRTPNRSTSGERPG